MSLGNWEGRNAANRVRRPAFAWNLRFAVYKSTFPLVFATFSGFRGGYMLSGRAAAEMQPILYFIQRKF